MVRVPVFGLHYVSFIVAVLALPAIASAQATPASAAPLGRHCVTTPERTYRGVLMPWLKYTPSSHERCEEPVLAQPAPEPTPAPMQFERVAGALGAERVVYAPGHVRPNTARLVVAPLAAVGMGVLGAALFAGILVYAMAESGSFCSGTGCAVAFGIAGGLGYSIGNVLAIQMISERMGGEGRIGGAIMGEVIGVAVGTALIVATQEPWMLVPALLLPPLAAMIGSELEIASRGRRHDSFARSGAPATTMRARLSPAVMPWSSQGHITGATMGISLTTF